MLASEEEKNSARKKAEGIAILERAGHTDGRCLNKELREVRSPSDTRGKSLPGRQVLEGLQEERMEHSCSGGSQEALDRCVTWKSREVTNKGPYRALCALALH